MMFLRHSGGWVILLSFVIALLLDSIALPVWADRFRPNWPALALIYWSMALPHRVGIGSGWVLGLLVDAAKGSLIGQNALGFALIAYLTIRTHRRIRVFPLWQQALSVMLFLLCNQLLIFWINGMIGYPPRDWWFLTPVVGSMLFWPWVFIVLRDLRRHFLVS